MYGAEGAAGTGGGSGGVTEKAAFEQRPEGSEGTSHVGMSSRSSEKSVQSHRGGLCR